MKKRKNTRLETDVYKNRIVHITICVKAKKQLFINSDIADSVKNHIIEYSQQGIELYAYAVMPDHIHLLVNFGDLYTPSDFVKSFKGKLASELRKSFNLHNVWQKGFYNHVARKEEDLYAMVLYIMNNPVRKKLVEDFRSYKWCGSSVYDFRAV